MKNDIIERIKDKLRDYEGVEVYSCDLAYTLFEGENMDGTATYNSYDAKEWVKTYFDEIGDVWEELNFQFGGDFMKDKNPFENPEQFMVVIILESASYLLGQCKYISDRWNDKIEIDKRNIRTISYQLDQLNDGRGIYEN